MNKKIKLKYGDSNSQFCELHLPQNDCVGTVCLLHGGFWSMPYGLDQFDEVATDLTHLGYCVWNIEYRRIGESDYDWRSAFEDALTSINELEKIKKDYPKVDLDNIYIAGHSAGGHLAIWLNTQALNVKVKKYIGLAPILDLRLAFNENAGDGAVRKLLVGSPMEYPERYDCSSPIEFKKKNGPELIVHGMKDDYVSSKWSERYYAALGQLNDHIEFIQLQGCGHMDFINTDSIAYKTFVENLR